MDPQAIKGFSMAVAIFAGLVLGYWLPVSKKTDKKIFQKGYRRRFFIGATLFLPIAFITGWLPSLYIGGVTGVYLNRLIDMKEYAYWSRHFFMGLVMFFWVYVCTLGIGKLSTIGTTK